MAFKTEEQQNRKKSIDERKSNDIFCTIMRSSDGITILLEGFAWAIYI
jgi:hypothetical protein